MTPSGRQAHTDEHFEDDVTDSDYSNRLFTRVDAKERKFKKVNFRFTIFDTCYFRKCTFDSCIFVGCRFKDSNFVGSSFIGCEFEYATFEKTLIENDVLDTCAPSWENVQLRFARTLRTNYQSLGDSESANKAFQLELEATEVLEL